MMELAFFHFCWLSSFLFALRSLSTHNPLVLNSHWFPILYLFWIRSPFIMSLCDNSFLSHGNKLGHKYRIIKGTAINLTTISKNAYVAGFLRSFQTPRHPQTHFPATNTWLIWQPMLETSGGPPNNKASCNATSMCYQPSRQLTVNWQPTMLKFHKESDFHLPQSQNCLRGNKLRIYGTEVHKALGVFKDPTKPLMVIFYETFLGLKIDVTSLCLLGCPFASFFRHLDQTNQSPGTVSSLVPLFTHTLNKLNIKDERSGSQVWQHKSIKTHKRKWLFYVLYWFAVEYTK